MRIACPHLQCGVTENVVQEECVDGVISFDLGRRPGNTDLCDGVGLGVVHDVTQATRGDRSTVARIIVLPGRINQTSQEGCVGPCIGVSRIANNADSPAIALAQKLFRKVDS